MPMFQSTTSNGNLKAINENITLLCVSLNLSNQQLETGTMTSKLMGLNSTRQLDMYVCISNRQASLLLKSEFMPL